MELAGIKDDFILLSNNPRGLAVYLGRNHSNILIFHPIEEPRESEELLAHIREEEKGYLFDKLNHQHKLVAYISKLPLMRSGYTLFYQSFDDVNRFILDSMYDELLKYLKEKANNSSILAYNVVKDGVVKEVPYF
ncbi:hypothetical protein [Oceanobacillus salinisoli]|uniref:hypothetical protein n=1 Tax=Oceanobacillus salinisoli TaxID=2678611 RepID=UPI0012E199EB|nr:hypothetical protein [Oceanobacillus salinisoli]